MKASGYRESMMEASSRFLQPMCGWNARIPKKDALIHLVTISEDLLASKLSLENAPALSGQFGDEPKFLISTNSKV